MVLNPGSSSTIAPTRISKTAPSSAAFSAGASNITAAKPGASDLSIARPLADRQDHPAHRPNGMYRWKLESPQACSLTTMGYRPGE